MSDVFRPLPPLHVRGARYAAWEAGPPDGEPVALGHGYLMTHLMYEAAAAALAEAGYRCITWDWRGQGASEVTAGGYDPWELARDQAAVLNALGVPRCHAVGFSMGGYAALRLALLRPELVATLTLADTAAAGTTGLQRLRYSALLAALGLLGYGPVVPQVLPILFGPTFLRDPGRRAEVARWKAVIMANDRTGIVRAGRGIFGRDDVSDWLGEITVPVLLIAGEDEAVHSVADHEAMAARLPDARVVPIPAAGHSTLVEQPEVSADALLRFLRAHPLHA